MARQFVWFLALFVGLQADAEVLRVENSKAFFSNCPASIQLDLQSEQGKVIVTPTAIDSGCSVFKTLQPLEFKIDRDPKFVDGRSMISASLADQVLLIIDYRQSEDRIKPKHAPDPDQPATIKTVLLDVSLLTTPQARWFLMK